MTRVPDDAIDILLAGHSELIDTRARETVVRALGAAKEPFDGRSLTACFEQADDEGLKWVVLNTIALARPHLIDDWLVTIADTPAGETLRTLL